MRLLLPLWAAAALALGACTTSPPVGAPSAAPRPDGRDLSEQPLDITDLPQP